MSSNKFERLTFKKDVLEELYNLISSSEMSQPPETFLNENGSLYYLKASQDPFFQEILKTSIEEFLNNIKIKDLIEVERYDDSIFDKKFLYLEKSEIPEIATLEDKILNNKAKRKLNESLIKEKKSFDFIVKYYDEKVGIPIIGFQDLNSRYIFDLKKAFFFESSMLKALKKGVILKPKEYFDYFIIGEIVFVRTLYFFENKFKFYKKYEESKDLFFNKLKENNNVIGKDITLKGTDYFDKYVSERKTFVKKIHNIFKIGNYQNFDFEGLEKVIKDFNLKINIDKNNKEIILDKETNIKDFLELLNELYYVSELSNKKMKANEANII